MLTPKIKQFARQLGFSSVGVCPAVTPTGLHRFAKWLADGYHGEMHYLRERQQAYEHPKYVLDGVRSLVMLTLNYRTESPQPVRPGQGRVSRYAWGDVDYHDWIHVRLKSLQGFVQAQSPGATVRGVVDTAPLLEREFAQLAGLGWIGKHTLLLNRNDGSWFFLAALLTDLTLDYDSPETDEYCGTCTACMDACPTQAFPEPDVLDATRCISYLTIELRDAIPNNLRDGIQDWLFGCDICQEVCPWNRSAPKSEQSEFHPQPNQNPVELAPLFELDDEAFRQRFRRTALWRTKRRGLLRNAAIVLGNQKNTESITALSLGLQDAEPLVRSARAALGQVGGQAAAAALRQSMESEDDAEVMAEIQSSLAKC